jgi:hypothetical protein
MNIKLRTLTKGYTATANLNTDGRYVCQITGRGDTADAARQQLADHCLELFGKLTNLNRALNPKQKAKDNLITNKIED